LALQKHSDNSEDFEALEIVEIDWYLIDSLLVLYKATGNFQQQKHVTSTRDRSPLFDKKKFMSERRTLHTYLVFEVFERCARGSLPQ